MIERLELCKSNLEMLMLGESNVLNVADVEWLIFEVERLREALELHNLRAALDSYQNAKSPARPEPTRPDPGISESVKHPYPPIPPPPPNEGVTATEGWGRWWKR